jgi:hypothetical protein
MKKIEDNSLKNQADGQPSYETPELGDTKTMGHYSCLTLLKNISTLELCEHRAT